MLLIGRAFRSDLRCLTSACHAEVRRLPDVGGTSNPPRLDSRFLASWLHRKPLTMHGRN